MAKVLAPGFQFVWRKLASICFGHNHVAEAVRVKHSQFCPRECLPEDGPDWRRGGPMFAAQADWNKTLIVVVSHPGLREKRIVVSEQSFFSQ